MKKIASILTLLIAVAALANSSAGKPTIGVSSLGSTVVADSEGHGGGKGHRADSEGHGGGKGPHKMDTTVYSA